MLTYTPYDNPYYDHFSKQPWMLEPEQLDAPRLDVKLISRVLSMSNRDSWKGEQKPRL